MNHTDSGRIVLFFSLYYLMARRLLTFDWSRWQLMPDYVNCQLRVAISSTSRGA